MTTDQPRVSAVRALKVCRQDHGGDGNAATVYGHHGSVRVCIRLYDSNVWVYDPRWEEA